MSRLTSSPCLNSFGDPNPQSPAQQTPTSTVFTSPVFETPKPARAAHTDQGNWTPRFAEDYSVFNSTPGNLRGISSPFTDFAPATPTSSSNGHKRLLSAEEIASRANYFSPVDPAQRLASSPSTHNIPKEYRREPAQQQSPTLSRSRISKKAKRASNTSTEQTQTATPPPSTHKGGRKLAPKLIMQNDQGFGQPDFTGASQQQHDLAALVGASEDMFSYPLSAPVTAPGSFWDGSAPMAMDLDFVAAAGPAMFQAGLPVTHNLPVTQAGAASFDWSGDLQFFPDPSMSQHVPNPGNMQPSKLLVRKPDHNAPHGLGGSDPVHTFMTPTDDPFGMLSPSGAVNPGLLFSRPQTSPMEAAFNPNMASLATGFPNDVAHASVAMSSRGTNGKEPGNVKPPNRQLASSPVKAAGRPGLGRSLSENRGKKAAGRTTYPPLVPAPRPLAPAPNGLPSEPSRPTTRPSGRNSPLKSQHRLSSLASIPESLPQAKPRAAVRFTIDSRGRARAETTAVPGQSGSERELSRSSSARDLSTRESWDQSDDESSTDDEPIIIPSRNTSFNASFALPDPRKPVGSIFHSSRRSISDRSASSTDGPGASINDGESEAETLMNEHSDKNGDAASELRKVVEDRQKRSNQMSSTQSQRFAPVASQSMRGSFISPSGRTEPGMVAEGHSVRCVCNRNGSGEEDGYMVQW
ncbi:hypothetical protein B0I35DRAFT_404595 [Stachybotrys elegans]|uniref:PHD finger domain protein n=1 Tax=Stachybotrys elegans TaxID=80388 RepID=A0A8K0WXK7_9HYPO|nr:hypothetical protein B0I35DRAFT_404595 [Stachybotrys elegans]